MIYRLKKVLLIFPILLLLISAAGLSACGKNTYIGICPNEIEYGQYFYVPDLFEGNGTLIARRNYSITLTTPSGDEIDDFISDYPAGMYLLKEIGDYKYDYYYNGTNYSLTVTCTEDKSAPYLKNELSLEDVYYRGSYFKIVGGEFTDPSKLNDNVCNDITYWFCSKTVSASEMENDLNRETHRFDDNEKYINVTGDLDTSDGEEKLLLKYLGRYVVVMPAQDRKGNKTDYIYHFDTVSKYYDENLCEADEYGLTFSYKDGNNVLMEFSESGYTQYTDSVYGWGDATNKISCIEKDGYSVLYATPTRRLSPHFILRIRFFDSVPTEQIKYVYFRYRVDQLKGSSDDGRTNYDDYSEMLYGVPYNYPNDALGDYLYSNDKIESNAYPFLCVSGSWQYARVPVEKFLYKNENALSGVKLCVTGEIYIDRIWFGNEDFNDSDRADGVLCDFGEEEYVYQVSKSVIGDGANVSVISADNLSKYSVPNKDLEDDGILLVSSISSTARSACVDIELFEEVKASTGKYICFKIYYDGRIKDGNKYKFYDQLLIQRAGIVNYEDANLFVEVVKSENVDEYREIWKTVKIPSTVFADDGENFDKISLLVLGSVYIDSIWVEQV